MQSTRVVNTSMASTVSPNTSASDADMSMQQRSGMHLAGDFGGGSSLNNSAEQRLQALSLDEESREIARKLKESQSRQQEILKKIAEKVW